jgi:hypothetical protein
MSAGDVVVTGFYCPQCKRVMRGRVTVVDGCSYHAMSCDVPMVPCHVVERVSR